MSNFWSGSADNVISGSTPFGIYDTDSDYQTDGPKVASWCAKRLGYPIVDVELVDLNFYACFEEAVSEYSQQINHYNTRNWMWEHYGNSSTGSNFSSTGSHQAETSVGGLSFTLSEQYGQLVNVGGNATMFTGSITLSASKQVYDLPTESTLELSLIHI